MHYDPYALMQTRYEQQERIAEGLVQQRLQ